MKRSTLLSGHLVLSAISKSPRLDTAGGNPFAMTAHMLINTKSEGLGEGEDSPLSSPVLDESYKIRIPLSRSSLSPHSPEVGKHKKTLQMNVL